MAGRDFVDTNVLIHSFQARDPVRQSAALRVLDRGRRGELVISTQVLMEFYSVASGKLVPRIPVPIVAEAARRFAEMPVVAVTPALVLSAIGRSHDEGIAIWDALIVEAALSAGCARLLSEDFTEGREFDGLRVENPFRA